MKNYNLAIAAVKILSADIIQKANSGHPGVCLGMAEMAVSLWCNHFKHNPLHPNWFNRDRFVISNGHASALLYSLLHFSGYEVSLEDLKQFRQLHSITPGHPEYGLTYGVDASTGPLGQGLANAVGMALAEHLLAKEFNREQYKIVNHYTYVFVGDGCLMEGVSHEVSSLAGTLGLNKLIVLYDSNKISIDGNIKSWFNENVADRYQAYNWQVQSVNGHDLDQIDQAIAQAKLETNKPSLIICNTIIGNGIASKQGNANIHGTPLSNNEIDNLRQNLNWQDPAFVIPDEVYEQFSCSVGHESKWDTILLEYEQEYPDAYAEFIRRISCQNNQQLLLTKNQYWQKFLKITKDNSNNQHYKNISTRTASQLAINHYAQILPELFGSSADLTASTCTNWNNYQPLTRDNNWTGNYLKGGVREFGLAAITNGIMLHTGFKAFTATFLTFSDYARNAIRMAALMKIASIFVYTHDSIGVGEDGPTHQPIEHLSSLRIIPNLELWRPADLQETIIAWGCALTAHNKPSALIFARQNTGFINKDLDFQNDIAKGGYIISLGSHSPDLVIIATGSEVEIAQQVANKLTNTTNYKTRVVSMPSTTVFDLQSLEYKNMVIPPQTKLKVAIEAGSKDFWHKYVGLSGLIFGIDDFGLSANSNDLYHHFGLTADNIVANIISKLYIRNLKQ